MKLIELYKDWRERRYWQQRHVDFVRRMVSDDWRWLGANPIADELTTRYRAALSPDWFKRQHEDVSDFRTRLCGKLGANTFSLGEPGNAGTRKAAALGHEDDIAALCERLQGSELRDSDAATAVATMHSLMRQLDEARAPGVKTCGNARSWDGWDEWEKELTSFLSTLAERSDEIGRRADGLGQFLPELRVAFARQNAYGVMARGSHTERSPHPDDARAYAIADRAMFEQLRDHCFKEKPDRWILTSWAASTLGVKTFAEAKPQIQQAFAWLQPRGFVELASDSAGEFIRMLREPGAVE
jgi:hypothetical protein